MTLSSGSRQHRKSMLPTPRLSSRIGSRRTTSGDTSRIARRVPSPMLAAPASFISGSSMLSRLPHPSASRILPPLEFCARRAGSPSRIPSPSVRTSFPTPEQSETSSPPSTLNVEGGSAEAPYPTPPASVETKHGRSNGQEGRTNVGSFAQHQNTSARGVAALARHLSQRRPSAALTSFSRTENSTPGDSTSYPDAHKKLATTSSVSGKENCRPPVRARVLVPPAPAIVVPPHPIQRTAVAHIPSSEASPRPLVIKKKPPHPPVAGPGQGLQAQSSAESAVVPAGMKALIGDLDCFEKEWTGMFDELYASASLQGGVLSNGSTRRHPIVESETPGTSQVDHLGKQTSNSETAGGTRLSSDRGQVREMTAVPLTPSASAGSIRTIHASTSASIDGDTIHFDVSAASLVRWQHRDNTMLKDAPTTADMVPELSAVFSASKSDPPADTTAHRHSQKAVLRSVPQPITPRAQRLIPLLPGINQSPVISGPHLVEMTAAALSNRNDEIAKFPEPPPTATRGTETTRRSASSRPHPPSVVFVAPLSFSPTPVATSLVSVSIPYTSSPLAHQRPHGSPPRRIAHASSDAAPTRSTSLRGLRAIFKRTSSGLTNGQRQRAESLKELIGEPRVLSLGSVSISNLRDAGIPGGGAVEFRPMDGA